MKTLRINDTEVAIIAEDGSLNGGARISGAHIVFNQVADAKRCWELLTSDSLEYKAPEPEPAPAMHLADLEMLNRRIDELEEQLTSVRGYAVHSEEVNDMIEDAITEHERHGDHPDDDHIHDLIAEYITDDTTGVLRRKIVAEVAGKLMR